MAQELDRQNDYMMAEDKVTALGVARDIASSYLNPFFHLQYNPKHWNVTKGRIYIPHTGQGSLGSGVTNIAKRLPWVGDFIKKHEQEFKARRFIGLDPSSRFGISALGNEDLINQSLKEDKLLTTKHGFDRKQSLQKAKLYVSEIEENIPKNYKQQFRKSVRPIPGNKQSAAIYNNYKNALKTIDDERFFALPRRLKGLTPTWAGLGKTAFRGVVLAGKSYAMFSIATGMLQAASFIATPVIQSIVSNTEQALRQFRNMSQVEMGGQLPLAYLSRGAATERQRAIEAISKAQINGRSVFGNEAAHL